MTDRRTCPLANKADVVIVAYIDGLGFTNSYVAPLSLSEVSAGDERPEGCDPQ